MAHRFVRSIQDIEKIVDQPLYTNERGDVLVDNANHVFMHVNGKYIPLSFPMNPMASGDETKGVDVKVDDNNVIFNIAKGEQHLTINLGSDDIVSMSDDVVQAFQRVLDIVTVHGGDNPQVVEQQKKFIKLILGKIEASQVSDKVANTLTIQQQGHDDVVYDGSEPKVINIAGGGSNTDLTYKTQKISSADVVPIITNAELPAKSDNGDLVENRVNLSFKPSTSNVEHVTSFDVTNTIFTTNIPETTFQVFPDDISTISNGDLYVTITNSKVTFTGNFTQDITYTGSAVFVSNAGVA